VQNKRSYFVLCQGAKTANSIDYLKLFATQAKGKRTKPTEKINNVVKLYNNLLDYKKISNTQL